MVKKTTWRKVPDAWDDDWETIADQTAAAEPAEPEPGLTLSRKERLAQHEAENRKLWEAAETQPPPFFYQTAPSPPLAQPFLPPVKVLARKPGPQLMTRRDPITGGMATVTISDHGSDEDDGSKKPRETAEEIRLRKVREREDKQRRYDEARAKIFGDGSGSARGAGGKSNPSSGRTTPGNETPPRANDARRGRGKGKGALRAADRALNGEGQASQSRGSGAREWTEKESSQSTGFRKPEHADKNTELFDPNYSAKPGSHLERRGGALSSGRSTPREEELIIRTPRGPDGSGRGGFGFARGPAAAGS